MRGTRLSTWADIDFTSHKKSPIFSFDSDLDALALFSDFWRLPILTRKPEAVPESVCRRLSCISVSSLSM